MKKLILLFLSVFIYLNAQSVPQGVYNKLKKSNNLISKKKYSQAKNILIGITNSQNKLARSYAYEALGNIAIHQNRYKNTIKWYEKILQLNAMKKKDIDKIMFSLSQIYLSEKKYKKSINYSKRLLLNSSISRNSIYENLALAYYYDEQYKKSISYIKHILKTKKQKESWYKMLYSAYVSTKNYNDAILIIKYMIKTYNKNENYWMQLVSLYQIIGNQKKSLATLELIYENDIVNKKKNVMYLLNILIQNGIYNKAAIFIEDSFKKNILKKNEKNSNLLLSCLLKAKNYKKVIPILNSTRYKNKDKYRLILGNIFYNKAKYKKTINILKNYKFIKNTKYEGQGYILLALCFYELDDFESSKKYFKMAFKNPYEKKRAKSLMRNLNLNN